MNQRQFYDRVVAELNLDTNDPFTKILANTFALADQRDHLKKELAELHEEWKADLLAATAGIKEATEQRDNFEALYLGSGGQAPVSIDPMVKFPNPLTSTLEGAEESEINTTLLRLMQFYGVQDVFNLAFAQMRHVSKLQDKLPKLPDTKPGYVPRA